MEGLMPPKKSRSGEKKHNLTVVIRIRPIFQEELGYGVITHKVDDTMVMLMDPNGGDPLDVLRAKRSQDKKYVFDAVFDAGATQEEVYRKTTETLVDNVLNGYNGTVFAYGATGSGKTYTMVGTDQEPGIMVRALRDIFATISGLNPRTFRISMSYLEVYNETIRDLLNPSSGPLDLREDSKGNHQVIGLTEEPIQNANEVMSLLSRGNRERTQESTGANRTSSRSHALLLILVRRDSASAVRLGKLCMVDLAGSERAAQTQNTGKRLMEGAHINKSLLALGNCINALAERGARYVNFRDSKLTRLLKETLSGNCRTVMIAHVAPSGRHLEETRNTLSYADRAKNITNKVHSNVHDVTYHVAQYQTIISELRREVARLQDQLEGQQRVDEDAGCTKLSEQEMDSLKAALIQAFQQQMEGRNRLLELDTALMALSTEHDRILLALSEWESERTKTSIDYAGSGANSDHRESIPEEVRQLLEELQYVQMEYQRCLRLKDAAEQEFRACREHTYRLEQSLPERASCGEQRDLLDLLTKVHQLEIEKMEMQADQLVKEHELRQKDLMIQRYYKQRHLCEEIIAKQRALINAMASSKHGNAASVMSTIQTSQELRALYRLYQQELKDTAPYRPYSGLRPLGSSESMWELHKPQEEWPRSNTLPPVVKDEGEQQLFIKRQRPPSLDSETCLGIHSLPATPNNAVLPPLHIKSVASSASFNPPNGLSKKSTKKERAVRLPVIPSVPDPKLLGSTSPLVDRRLTMTLSNPQMVEGKINHRYPS